ncbi:DUF2813 domain-containing protein [Jeongeupia naejangsanensis]|uniref:DUF2813 domain-containing protein n=1 Tax=Jeongeupia naejangsanensis TaxID=613195 RepID=A0ABS2BN60_9NEIS|nr:DUF2813 domain-containing protein [Jeongeupia naejangsanensis]MBM3117060.1 DUF2813 domain-containing protein [Jeongeupia naejangsanensis]
MRLIHLQVDNFRGISRIALSLEADRTVLFGENNWGKTSLIEALARCLGPGAAAGARFDVDDFHHDATGVAAKWLAITLTFGDDEPQPLPLSPRLTSLAWRDRKRRWRLSLRIAAHRNGDGNNVVVRRELLGPAGKVRRHPEADALACELVERHPVLRLRELQLSQWLAQPPHDVAPIALDNGEAPAETVQRTFEALLQQPHKVGPGVLQQGIAAMRELLWRHADRLHQPSVQRLAEDIAAAPVTFRDHASLLDIANRAGSSTQQLALLFLLGSLLEARGPSGLHDGEMPLLLVEDPETHLHPTQLIQLWGLVEQLPVQKLVTTNSGELLASFPHHSLRRLVRGDDKVFVYQLGRDALSRQDARKVGFHVRANRPNSLFARTWLLVEGETEFWLLPELARRYGVNLGALGIRSVEFAQAGLAPLIKFADAFGIRWHLITDGDDAGRMYANKTRALLHGRDEARHLTVLPSRDIEHYLFENGFDDVYREAAHWTRGPLPDTAELIHRAIRREAKPGMALAIAEAAEQRGKASIPPLLARLFDTLAELAQDEDARETR